MLLKKGFKIPNSVFLNAFLFFSDTSILPQWIFFLLKTGNSRERREKRFFHDSKASADLFYLFLLKMSSSKISLFIKKRLIFVLALEVNLLPLTSRILYLQRRNSVKWETSQNSKVLCKQGLSLVSVPLGGSSRTRHDDHFPLP